MDTSNSKKKKIENEKIDEQKREINIEISKVRVKR